MWTIRNDGDGGYVALSPDGRVIATLRAPARRRWTIDFPANRLLTAHRLSFGSALGYLRFVEQTLQATGGAP